MYGDKNEINKHIIGKITMLFRESCLIQNLSFFAGFSMKEVLRLLFLYITVSSRSSLWLSLVTSQLLKSYGIVVSSPSFCDWVLLQYASCLLSESFIEP